MKNCPLSIALDSMWVEKLKNDQQHVENSAPFWDILTETSDLTIFSPFK